tara:strand:+ start:226 stop:510 length:285 start_codon:yes stop_codon:yes gene_type:complete
MRTESFPSQSSFDRLDHDLMSQFNFIGSILPHSSKPDIEILSFRFGSKSFTGADLYNCKSCNIDWELSSPDNAWRGYFLPIELKGNYETYLQRA